MHFRWVSERLPETLWAFRNAFKPLYEVSAKFQETSGPSFRRITRCFWGFHGSSGSFRGLQHRGSGELQGNFRLFQWRFTVLLNGFKKLQGFSVGLKELDGFQERFRGILEQFQEASGTFRGFQRRCKAFQRGIQRDFKGLHKLSGERQGVSEVFHAI